MKTKQQKRQEEKLYIQQAKNRIIISNILSRIYGDNKTEDDFAEMIEESTNGEISKEEFHDWIAGFDTNEVSNKDIYV